MKSCKISILTIMMFLSAGLCFSQFRKKDSLSIITEKMAAHNIYELTYAVGITGAPATQYLLFRRLEALASNEQLLHIARHHLSAVVRLYAYQALRKRNVKIPSQLIVQLKADHTKVTTLRGCIAEEKTAAALVDREIFVFVPSAKKSE
jgi:hypothetical protein